MKQKKVISKKNFPSRNPISATILYITALGYWEAPQWLWGASGLLILFVWILWVISFFNEDEVDIVEICELKQESPSKNINKSKFQQRVEAKMRGF